MISPEDLSSIRKKKIENVKLKLKGAEEIKFDTKNTETNEFF